MGNGVSEKKALAREIVFRLNEIRNRIIYTDTLFSEGGVDIILAIMMIIVEMFDTNQTISKVLEEK